MRYTELIFLILVFCFGRSDLTGALDGSITDTCGETVSGAMVVLTDESNPGRSFTAVSDFRGQYKLDGVPVQALDETAQPFQLGQNFPNPFNPATMIPFSLDKPGYITLNIYSLLGQQVRVLASGYFQEGRHTLAWDGADDNGSNVAAGIYLYQLRNGDSVISRKMTMVDGGSGFQAGIRYNQSKPAIVSVSGIFSLTVTRSGFHDYVREGLEINENSTLNIIMASLSSSERNGITFAPIPGGTFRMGDESGNLPPACRPAHTITIASSYEMSAGEITNAQYMAFLMEAYSAGEISATITAVSGKTLKYGDMEFLNMAGNDREPEDRCRIHFRDGDFQVEPGYENWPVIWVTWYGAKRFAMKYGFDLPTEAEWENAARGGDQQPYGTGNGLISKFYVNYMYSQIDHPVATGSYGPNPFGLFDMSGNVSEWCQDWYNAAYYAVSPELDPKGAADAPFHAIRGGSWLDDANYCRTAFRDFGAPSAEAPWLGFRVVYRAGGVVY